MSDTATAPPAILSLSPSQASPAESAPRKPGRPTGSVKPTATLEPLLISAKQAAQLAGVSTPTWWRLHAAGKVPAPTRLGGRTLWHVETLKAWISAGCPDRKAWAAAQGRQR